jgi:hypothetical protein
VGPAAHGHQQVVVTGEGDGAADVGYSNGATDQTWTPVDIGIPDLARLGITRIIGSDEWAAQALLERFDGGRRERGLPAGERRRLEVSHGFPPLCGSSEIDISFAITR